MCAGYSNRTASTPRNTTTSPTRRVAVIGFLRAPNAPRASSTWPAAIVPALKAMTVVAVPSSGAARELAGARRQRRDEQQQRTDGQVDLAGVQRGPGDGAQVAVHRGLHCRAHAHEHAERAVRPQLETVGIALRLRRGIGPQRDHDADDDDEGAEEELLNDPRFYEDPRSRPGDDTGAGTASDPAAGWPTDYPWGGTPASRL